MEQLAKSIPFARNTLVTFGRKYLRLATQMKMIVPALCQIIVETDP